MFFIPRHSNISSLNPSKSNSDLDMPLPRFANPTELRVAMQKLIGNKATMFAKGIQNSTLTIDGSVDGEIFYSLKEAKTVIEA